MRLKPIKYSWDEKLYRCTKCWEFKDKNSFHKRIHSWKMGCPQPIDLFNNYNQ